MLKKQLALSGAALLAVSIAQAAPVTVNNFSFEDDVIPAGATIVTPASWTGFQVGSGGNADIGLGRPGSEFSVKDPLAAPADGNNYLWLNKFNGDGTQILGIYQNIGSLLANTTYTLTVAIGQRADGGPNGAWSPGIISLLNGSDNTGLVLATGGGLPSTADTWQDYTLSFTTGSTVSGDLTIALSVQDSSHIQADFDNVRLDAMSVPEPSTAALAGVGLLLFALRRKRAVK